MVSNSDVEIGVRGHRVVRVDEATETKRQWGTLGVVSTSDRGVTVDWHDGGSTFYPWANVIYVKTRQRPAWMSVGEAAAEGAI